MISQSDVQGRLRLLRYGLIVVVVVAFFVGLLAPYAVAAPWAAQFNELAAANGVDPVTVGIFDYIGTALIATIVTAVLAVVIYLVYSNVISRGAKS